MCTTGSTDRRRDEVRIPVTGTLTASEAQKDCVEFGGSGLKAQGVRTVQYFKCRSMGILGIVTFHNKTLLFQ